jgi:hypothetical protein
VGDFVGERISEDEFLNSLRGLTSRQLGGASDRLCEAAYGDIVIVVQIIGRNDPRFDTPPRNLGLLRLGLCTLVASATYRHS